MAQSVLPAHLIRLPLSKEFLLEGQQLTEGLAGEDMELLTGGLLISCS